MISRISIFALATFACVATAGAQEPVKWTATSTASATPGGKTTVTLAAAIDPGWHIYSATQGPGGPMPTRITLPTGQPFALGGAITALPPHVAMDPNFGINVETYEDSASFTVPVTVAKTAKAGTKKMQINARYQVCNSSMCLPLKTAKLTADVKVANKTGK